MNAVNRYLVNTAQAKTGLSTGVLIGYAAQAALGLATAVLFLIALFFVFSDWLRFGATSTAIGMFLVFAALLIASMVWTSALKKRTRETAERALRRSSPLALSPRSCVLGSSSAAQSAGAGSSPRPSSPRWPPGSPQNGR